MKKNIKINNIWEKLIKENRCTQCGKKLTMTIDPMTGKESSYLFQCKKCMPNVIISVG